MRAVRFSLLFFALVTYSCIVNGQAYKWKFHFGNYSIDQGLPSQETYDVVTDSNGFLYISTDRGIVQFDGKEFLPVGFASSQKDYTLFKFIKDPKGGIWCSSYDQGIFYLENNLLYPYYYNDTLNKYRESDVLKDFCVAGDGSLYFYVRRFGHSIGKIDPTGKFRYVAATQEKQNDYPAFFHPPKIIPLLFQGPASIPDSNNTIYSDAVKPIPPIDLSTETGNFQKADGQITRLAQFIAAGNVLSVTYTGKKEPHYRRFPHEILCFKLVDTALWVGTRNGLYYFPSAFNLQRYDVYFAGLGINGICRDYQNGLWFASLQQGVFYMSPRQISTLEFSGRINDFFIEDDSLLTFHVEDKGFYSAGLTSRKLYIRNSTRKNRAQEAGAFVKKTCSLTGGISGLCLSEGFLLYSEKQGKICFDSRKKNHFTERVLSIASFRDTFWIGTASGIFTLSNGHIEKWKPEEKALQIKISDLQASGNKTLWIATLGQGLYSYDSILRPHREVSVAFIEDIYVDDDNDIWIGSNAGIFLNIKQRWFYFSKKSGLPSSSVRKIAYKNGQVYGLSGNKLFHFSLDKQSLAAIAPYAKLRTGIFVNGKRRKYGKMTNEEVTMTKDERRFRLIVQNPGFESAGYTISYRFAEKDTGWTSIEGNTFTLTDISPGKHKLQVRYTERITPSNPYIFTIDLVKQPGWTQTLWFQLLLIILGILITIPLGIFFFRGALAKRKLQYEKILADQRVLSTQLNPHFTYNALNSMQLLLYEKNWEQALTYNERLGKILRGVFRQSEHTFIPLTQELKFIEEYLSLEQIRIKHQIDFQINFENGINPDSIPIPPLLLQPLIENTIWHGYGRAESHMKIQCTVTAQADDTVAISIKDNGKGFDQANKKPVHSALKNMANRITLLNSSRLVHITFEVYSPERRDGNTGTETITTIKYLYEKESNYYRR